MREGSRADSRRRLAAASQISRRQWLASVVASPLVFAAEAAGRKLEPRDEASRDPDLDLLLQGLTAIVDRRDEQQLLSKIGPKFRVEFEAGKGRTSFSQFWKTGLPDSEIWNVLSRLLAIGGTFYSPTLFAIPYVFTGFPIDLDPFGHVVALKESVKVHRDFLLDSPVVAALSFEIAATEPALPAPVRLDRTEWVHVIAAGRSGYVASREVWSPAGHRMFLEKRRGRWEWISLVCAD